MEKYFYKTEEDGITCTELCEYSHDKQTGHDLKIGSLGCIECDNCVGHDYEEEWIKCEVYSAFAEVETLKSKVIELSKIIDDQNKAIVEYKEYEETVISMLENKE